MNFEFSDEQRLLSESVNKLLTDRYDFSKRGRYSAGEDGFSRALWEAFAELGLLALPYAEEDGGFGGGAEEIMIVMEAFGRALVVEPYLSHVVMISALLRSGAAPARRAGLAEGLISGSMLVAPACNEASSGYAVARVTTQARRINDGYLLDGAKTLVPHGGSADKFLVSARMDNAASEASDIGVFLVEATAPGITIRSYPTQDGLRAAEMTFTGVKLGSDALIIAAENGAKALQRMNDEALAAVCAEAVGAMDAMLQSTVDYLKTRKQFGQAIGTFQALQHRAADMVVELEQARSMALFATMMSRHDDDRERARALSSAKVQINRSARLISQACIQLHGGIGMTMEHTIGHYMKRLAMIEKSFGDTDFHMERLAAA